MSKSAALIIVATWLAGILSASPSDASWGQRWRAFVWPIVIAWHEVGPYIESVTPPPSPQPLDYSPSANPIQEREDDRE